MQKAEIASFARLMVTDTSRNLVRVFFLREKLKGLADGDWTGKRVHVIGAGAMGGDIAAWCAWNGFTVTLADMKAEPLGKAIARAAELYGKIGHKSIETRDALDRLIPDLSGEGVRAADLVIEAVPETLELKRKVYAATEPKMRPDAILATNTSSIPLEELRTGLQRPEHLVGLHFFNPVSRMQLVEVVSHDQVLPDVLAKARAFLGRIDRLPAPVKSAPGFLVNRALTPYMLEAMVMLNEGIKRETIDAAAVAFGMPMGPIELADTVGLDICLHVAEMLKADLDRPMPDVPHCCATRSRPASSAARPARASTTGRTASPVKDRDAPKPTDEMTDRLILPMLDVCVACLREGVVADEDTVDGAMIFATGFAPFRGGPMHYARARGVADIRRRSSGWRNAMASASGPIRAGTVWHDARRRRARPIRRSRIGSPMRSSRASARTSCWRCRSASARPITSPTRLFARAAADPSIRLRIFTALTLEKPRAGRASSGASSRRSPSACSAAIPTSPMPWRCTRARCRPTSRSTNSSSRPARGSASPPRSELHLRQLHPRAALCDRARRQRGRATRRQARARRRDALQPELQSRPHARSAGVARRAGSCDFLFVGQVNSELPFMPGDADVAGRRIRPAAGRAGRPTFRCSRRRASRSISPNTPPACTWRAPWPTAARCSSASDRSATRWRRR